MNAALEPTTIPNLAAVKAAQKATWEAGDFGQLATNLTTLSLFANQLTNVSLATDMRKLNLLGLGQNPLSSLNLPLGLTALAFINLRNNHFAKITFPPDMQRLPHRSASRFLPAEVLPTPVAVIRCSCFKPFKAGSPSLE